MCTNTPTSRFGFAEDYDARKTRLEVLEIVHACPRLSILAWFLACKKSYMDGIMRIASKELVTTKSTTDVMNG